MRILALTVAALALAACATTEELPKPAPRPAAAVPQPGRAPNSDPSIRNLPVHAITTTPPAPAAPAPVPVPAPATKPAERTLADGLAGTVLVSPWTFISRLQGSWQWANDPNFIATFKADGTVDWGPASGAYQMADASTVLYQLTAVNGQALAGQAPQRWRAEFFENGTVLVLTQGGQAMLFKRKETN